MVRAITILAGPRTKRFSGEKSIKKFQREVCEESLYPPDQRLPVAPLFKVWCAKGKDYWLSPMPYLRQIFRQVHKFLAKGQDFEELINILISAVNKGISPELFLKYVVLPRLEGDYDWRTYHRRHYPALRAILDILSDIRHNSAWSVERFTCVYWLYPRNVLSEVILVKYIGQMLATLPARQLVDSIAVEQFKGIWKRLSLKNFYFNELLTDQFLYPFKYREFSANTSLQLLVNTLSPLPDIERRLPRSNLHISHLRLYKPQTEKALTHRQKLRFNSSQYLMELGAYLRCLELFLSQQVVDPLVLSQVVSDFAKRCDAKFVAEYTDFMSLLQKRNYSVNAYAIQMLCYSDNKIREKVIQKKLESEPWIDPNLLNLAFDIGYIPIDLMQDKEQLKKITAGLSFETVLKYWIDKNPECQTVISLLQEMILNGSDKKDRMEDCRKLDELFPKPLLRHAFIDRYLTSLNKGYFDAVPFQQLCQELPQNIYLEQIQHKQKVVLQYRLPDQKFELGHEVKDKINFLLVRIKLQKWHHKVKDIYEQSCERVRKQIINLESKLQNLPQTEANIKKICKNRSLCSGSA
ncbi:MAG: hypothetical protein NZL89_03425 [Leptospiraceae bacterium]|nr:hypothetical protein [Leptospiraceae bacterium]